MIDLVFFIDDDFPTNFYHEIVGNKSSVVGKMISFLSAKQALQYFAEIAEGESKPMPDVLFLDLNMPELSGWEFLERFRALNLLQSPDIYILSTTITPKDQQRFDADPLVQAALHKPLTEQLLHKINLSLQNKAS